MEKLCSSPVLLERKGNRGDKRRDLGEEGLSQGGGRLFCLLDRRSFCLSHPSVTDIAKVAVFVEDFVFQYYFITFEAYLNQFCIISNFNHYKTHPHPTGF